MTSTPNRRDRFYQESDIESWSPSSTRRACGCPSATGSCPALSWTVDRLQKATDERDIRVLEEQVMALKHVLDKGAFGMTVDRLVALVIRSLSAENEVVDVHRSNTVYSDRVAVTVVDVDGDRWRLHVLRESWSAPA